VQAQEAPAGAVPGQLPFGSAGAQATSTSIVVELDYTHWVILNRFNITLR
jgi:hypothetical protein